MCLSSKPKSSPLPPPREPVVAPPPPEPTPESPVVGESERKKKSDTQTTDAKRKGTAALRIDLNVPGSTGGSNGLNIPV